MIPIAVKAFGGLVIGHTSVRRRSTSVAALLFFVGVMGTAQASLIIDRGLPSTNLNNTAGVDRSNVDWGFQPNNQYFSGDDFTLPVGTWQLDSIRIWAVAG